MSKTVKCNLSVLKRYHHKPQPPSSSFTHNKASINNLCTRFFKVRNQNTQHSSCRSRHREIKRFHPTIITHSTHMLSEWQLILGQWMDQCMVRGAFKGNGQQIAEPSTTWPTDLYSMCRNSLQLKPRAEDAERVRYKPNDCELRWAGKPRWCAHGNDASKPFHVGLLVPLAFAVGTDAENKQNQMKACGMVRRKAYSVVDSLTFTQFCAHVAQIWYQRFILQHLLDGRRWATMYRISCFGGGGVTCRAGYLILDPSS